MICGVSCVLVEMLFEDFDFCDMVFEDFVVEQNEFMYVLVVVCFQVGCYELWCVMVCGNYICVFCLFWFEWWIVGGIVLSGVYGDESIVEFVFEDVFIEDNVFELIDCVIEVLVLCVFVIDYIYFEIEDL